MTRAKVQNKRQIASDEEDRAAWIACLPAAAKLAVSQTLEDEETRQPPGRRAVCFRAPNPWVCTRDQGHDGPCAAVHASTLVNG